MNKSCGSECCGNNNNQSYGNYTEIALIALSVILLGFAVYTKNTWLYIASYIAAGYDILLSSVKNVIKGQFFDENFLMSIATIVALILGEFAEAVMVLLFFRVGDFLQHISVEKSRRSITSLMDIRPDYANLQKDGRTEKVSPNQVSVGDIIIIRPGERVPLDCVIEEGASVFDTSALTGESVPAEYGRGDNILSGFVCSSGLIKAKVTKPYSESAINRILELTQNAYQKKATAEKFITKFAKVYTPIVIALAAVVAVIPPLVTGQPFSDWIYRAMVFLVISCPCALVIGIPLSFFSGIGKASRSGILVKGSSYIESLTKVGSVVFDKTGTLTKGKFEISEINGGENLLKIAAYAEYHSSHPLARCIAEKFAGDVDDSVISNYSELSGYGVSVEIEGRKVLAGNEKLMQKNNIDFKPAEGTVIHVAVDGSYMGYITFEDKIKPDSAKAVKGLKGIKTYMLTGDNKASGEKVVKELGINEGFYSLLPEDKISILEKIKAGGKENVIFAGDGINDAPSLATADIGIAMGGIGSDAAIEAADIVIMNDSPAKIPVAIKIAKATKRMVIQNIIFAIGVKVIFMILGAMGIASMWLALFADTGVTFIVVLNAMRLAIMKFE